MGSEATGIIALNRDSLFSILQWLDGKDLCNVDHLNDGNRQRLKKLVVLRFQCNRTPCTPVRTSKKWDVIADTYSKSSGNVREVCSILRDVVDSCPVLWKLRAQWEFRPLYDLFTRGSAAQSLDSLGTSCLSRQRFMFISCMQYDLYTIIYFCHWCERACGKPSFSLSFSKKKISRVD